MEMVVEHGCIYTFVEGSSDRNMEHINSSVYNGYTRECSFMF